MVSEYGRAILTSFAYTGRWARWRKDYKCHFIIVAELELPV